MSTDPKKVIRNILLAYFLAAMFEAAAVNMSFRIVPVIVFTLFALLLYSTGILTLHQQYKKYKIPMYIFLEIIGIGLTIFCIVASIVACL